MRLMARPLERIPNIPCEEAVELVRVLVIRYGSVRQAGRAYDERFGYKGYWYPHRNGGKGYSGNGPRLMHRILSGETKTMLDRTYDQLQTLAAS
jgi:hypothetical protein